MIKIEDIYGKCKIKKLPEAYDNVSCFCNGYFKVRLNDKEGIIDEAGNVVIPCEYDQISKYKGEDFLRCCISENGRCKEYKTDFKTSEAIVPFKYHFISLFHEGLAVVKLDNKYGIIDEAGNEIVPCIYEDIGFYDKKVASVKINGKYGLIDILTGKELISCKYDSIERYFEILLVNLNGKYGLMDYSENEIVPCQYGIKFGGKKASFFLNRLDKPIIWINWIKDYEKWYGAFDETGKEIVPFIYDNLIYFNDELMGGKLDGKWTLLDAAGKEVNPSRYENIYRFYNGLAPVQKNGKWGVIDAAGKEVISCKYEDIRDERINPAYSGIKIDYMEVKENGKWGMINTAGEEVIPCQYEGIDICYDAFNNLMYIVVKNEGKWGIVDTAGKEVISCQYNGIGGIYKGLVEVYRNDQYNNKLWGLIDITGKEIIPCNYKRVGTFNNGAFLYVATYLEGVGILDSTGKQITPCKYKRFLPFQNGFAKVVINAEEIFKEKEGLIDTTGKEIVPCIYDWIDFDYFIENGTIKVKLKGKWGLLDASGKEVIPCMYDYISNVFDVDISGTFKTEGLSKVVIVKLKDKYGIMDITGKMLFSCKFDKIIFLTNGLIYAESKDAEHKMVLYDLKEDKGYPIVGDEVPNSGDSFMKIKSGNGMYIIYSPIYRESSTETNHYDLDIKAPTSISNVKDDVNSIPNDAFSDNNEKKPTRTRKRKPKKNPKPYYYNEGVFDDTF